MAIPPTLASNSGGNASRLELVSSNNVTPAREGYTGTEIDPPPMTNQNVQTSVSVHQGKVGGLRKHFFCYTRFFAFALV